MSRGVPIRRSLLIGSALVVVLLGLAVFAATFVPARTLVRAVVGSLVERTVQQTETELRRFVEPAERMLQSARSWGDAGLLDDERGPIERLLLPVVDRPYVEAVLVVDESGRGQRFSLRRAAVRAATETGDPGADRQSTVGAEPFSTPQSAAWLQGALARVDETEAEALYFTEPGILEDAQQLGMTGAVAFRSSSAEVKVFAMEFLLGGFQDFVAELELTDHSVVLITDDHDRLLAISDEVPLWQDRNWEWRLRRPSELDSPLVGDALQAVEAADPSGASEPIRFRHQGEDWWGQGREVLLGGNRRLGIAVLVPGSDRSPIAT